MSVKLYFTWMMPARAQLRIIWQMSSMLRSRSGLVPRKIAGISAREISDELIGSGTMSSEMPCDCDALAELRQRVHRPRLVHLRGRQAAADVVDAERGAARGGSPRSRPAACRPSSSPSATSSAPRCRDFAGDCGLLRRDHRLRERRGRHSGARQPNKLTSIHTATFESARRGPLSRGAARQAGKSLRRSMPQGAPF